MSFLRRDILHRFLGERQPVIFTRRGNDKPFFHHTPIVAWIETLSVSSGDERIHPWLRQLDHEPVLNEHGEDLVVDS
jgi:hypothetical protein